MYITDHPILGAEENTEMVNITVDGVPLRVRKGSMIAAALLANGIRITSYNVCYTKLLRFEKPAPE